MGAGFIFRGVEAVYDLTCIFGNAQKNSSGYLFLWVPHKSGTLFVEVLQETFFTFLSLISKLIPRKGVIKLRVKLEFSVAELDWEIPGGT